MKKVFLLLFFFHVVLSGSVSVRSPACDCSVFSWETFDVDVDNAFDKLRPAILVPLAAVVLLRPVNTHVTYSVHRFEMLFEKILDVIR